MSKNIKKNYEKLPRSFFLLFGIALLSLVLYLVGVISPRFAGWFNGTVAAFVRAVLAHLTSWLPFSLAEILLYLVPILLIHINNFLFFVFNHT